MNNKRQVYSFIDYQTLAPAAGTMQIITLVKPAVGLKVISLNWDIHIEVNPTHEEIHWPNQNFIYAGLNIGESGSPVISDIFTFSSPASIVENGSRFGFYTPGQKFFNSFYLGDTIKMRLYLNNYDVLVTYNITNTIIFEVESA